MCEWIIYESLPFTFAESVGLTKLVSLLKPDAVEHLVGATTIREDIDKMFKREREALKLKLVVSFFFLLFSTTFYLIYIYIYF
jgi:Na+-translocating ferredoxin:NAD+ oxidoreductase RnfE subunit